MLVTQWDSGYKSHRLYFVGDFHSCPFAEIFRGNALQTWHPIALCCSSNTKITTDVLRASLNNSFKNYCRLCVKRHNLTIQWSGQIVKKIRLHSSRHGWKSGLCGVRETYTKIKLWAPSKCSSGWVKFKHFVRRRSLCSCSW
jgi:hypothetical protein